MWPILVVVCALTNGDHNIPSDRRDEIAWQEAQAFLDANHPRSPFLRLLAMGYVESRFNPTGSEHDRARGYFGVLQIECSHCASSVQQMLLDPAKNILFAAGLLRRRGSVGAYYWGSVPRTRRGRRAVRRYEQLVSRAERIMRYRLQQCSDISPGGE